MVQQMGGRAGRRGFDEVGNVVFCGFNTKDVSRLLLGRPGDLLGYPALTPTTVLRLHDILVSQWPSLASHFLAHTFRGAAVGT
jgi:hypothetical protein